MEAIRIFQDDTYRRSHWVAVGNSRIVVGEPLVAAGAFDGAFDGAEDPVVAGLGMVVLGLGSLGPVGLP